MHFLLPEPSGAAANPWCSPKSANKLAEDRLVESKCWVLVIPLQMGSSRTEECQGKSALLANFPVMNCWMLIRFAQIAGNWRIKRHKRAKSIKELSPSLEISGACACYKDQRVWRLHLHVGRLFSLFGADLWMKPWREVTTWKWHVRLPKRSVVNIFQKPWIHQVAKLSMMCWRAHMGAWAVTWFDRFAFWLMYMHCL